MINKIENAFVNSLNDKGLPAMRKFSPEKINRNKAAVCVEIKKAELYSAGLGGYIGIGEADGTVKELYGQRARLNIGFEIYTPAHLGCIRCEEMLGELCSALYSADVKVTCFTANAPVYDSKSEMFRCDASAELNALLVRELKDGELSELELGGDAI